MTPHYRRRSPAREREVARPRRERRQKAVQGLTSRRATVSLKGSYLSISNSGTICKGKPKESTGRGSDATNEMDYPAVHGVPSSLDVEVTSSCLPAASGGQQYHAARGRRGPSESEEDDRGGSRSCL